ncbi:hypothetical protein Bpfe_031383 [Biomphalaria pfeifferi]|uniref:Uncharacterized protein n=1 Tax=Biomphalaria pfeifferi TaxID=112525 RepID=A0AAD8ESY0_BIOPF|nr:hypothetical protein Bpfe_031383 [Biomphalaria pfeifferi]
MYDFPRQGNRSLVKDEFVKIPGLLRVLQEAEDMKYIVPIIAGLNECCAKLRHDLSNACETNKLNGSITVSGVGTGIALTAISKILMMEVLKKTLDCPAAKDRTIYKDSVSLPLDVRARGILARFRNTFKKYLKGISDQIDTLKNELKESEEAIRSEEAKRSGEAKAYEDSEPLFSFPKIKEAADPQFFDGLLEALIESALENYTELRKRSFWRSEDPKYTGPNEVLLLGGERRCFGHIKGKWYYLFVDPKDIDMLTTYFNQLVGVDIESIDYHFEQLEKKYGNNDFRIRSRKKRGAVVTDLSKEDAEEQEEEAGPSSKKKLKERSERSKTHSYIEPTPVPLDTMEQAAPPQTDTEDSHFNPEYLGSPLNAYMRPMFSSYAVQYILRYS